MSSSVVPVVESAFVISSFAKALSGEFRFSGIAAEREGEISKKKKKILFVN